MPRNDAQDVTTFLTAKASERLEKEVEKELKKEDPKPLKAWASINENKEES